MRNRVTRRVIKRRGIAELPEYLWTCWDCKFNKKLSAKQIRAGGVAGSRCPRPKLGQTPMDICLEGNKKLSVKQIRALGGAIEHDLVQRQNLLDKWCGSKKEDE